MFCWWKYLCFEKGINFRNINLKDLKEIMEIKGAVMDRQMREKKVRDLLNKVRF